MAVIAVSVCAVPPAASAGPTTGAAATRMDWHRCSSPEQEGFQCATLRVPLNYNRPRGQKINLAVIRHRATEPSRRIGSVFFNPGGPGGRGTVALPGLYRLFPAPLRARFNIVSWDPRGTGSSTAVQCFSSLEAENRFLAGFPVAFPASKSEKTRWIRTYRGFGPRCGRRNGNLLRHVSTADTARDLNRLRSLSGDRKLNYFGISYGTFLGATYANMFPHRVRRMVLDGDINPRRWVKPAVQNGRSQSTFLRQRSDRGSAKTLRAFLDLCGRAKVRNCAFSGGSSAATRAKFRALLHHLRRHRVADLTYSDLVNTTVSDLDAMAPIPGLVAGWPALAQTLQDAWKATHGHPSRAPSLPDAAPTGLPIAPAGTATAGGQTNTYAGPEQQLSILCSESPNPGASEYRKLARFAYGRAGAVGLPWLWATEPCASWPAVAAHPYTGPWDRRTANPILVVQTTYDPATPHAGGKAMSRQLARARLLTVDGYGHATLLNPSACAARYESRYFLRDKLPPRGRHCGQNVQPFAPSG